jgi:hypothetical protein
MTTILAIMLGAMLVAGVLRAMDWFRSRRTVVVGRPLAAEAMHWSPLVPAGARAE